ncbi:MULTISPECIES: TolC family protein [unclassified Dehalobacter]|uniref:TolC family protein n=1 Tax=unclassified Dehalobacter TaxID=2635733 RepID=UPI00028AF8E2|nr:MULTISPECIES: TolC family protein [unclassified Dehalobacter]AFV03696.1 hypothetical protein DHBDCA_p2669 [Dehalobacter sp. DCA]AFV06683.1 hypothetical protein DCF50_p2680 [Dehalobacter sp. CF]
MKMKPLYILLLFTFCLMIPAPALALDYWDQFPNTIHKIEFNDIRTLLMSRNPTIRYNTEMLDSMAGTGISVYDSALNAQIQNLTLAYAKEAQYIQYNTQVQQVEVTAQQLILAEKSYQVSCKQYELGMISKNALSKAENDVKSLTTQMRDLQDSQKNIIKQFNLAIGQDADIQLELGPVPLVQDKWIKEIDANKDYESIKNNSYKERAANDYNIQSDEERKFKDSFYQTYQTLLDKQKALLLEQQKMTVAGNELKCAQLKADLGMLSPIQLQSQKLSYEGQKLALISAQNMLFLAYRNYEWAQEGLIVSSSSSASY